MQRVAIISLLLVASAAAASPTSQQDQVSSSVSGQQQGSVASSAVVSNSPAAQPSVVESPSNVEQPQQPHHLHQVHHPSTPVASYYSPAGMIQVVGNEQVGQNKPGVAGPVRSFEQYGQPESASLPPNYKPFGSWGLYIGGNPADGYYTNYYKALGNSVDKQQVGDAVKPTAALSPMLRQASSSPYVGSDYYPFAYSPSDLNSGARVPVDSPVVHSAHSGVVSPVQAGAQVYGSPASFETNYAPSPYMADMYATKKIGSAYAQKEVQAPQKEAVSPPSKGYQQQSRVYVYQPPVGQLAAPLVSSAVQSQAQPAGVQQHQHVVAYPVPVGSQIIGSQVGVDGAFAPYGVHAFTRYAVKPTVVSQDPSYYYNVHAPNNVPSYKQQVYTTQAVGPNYYPLNHYGYPVGQLHYSQGSLVPSIVGGEQPQYHGPVQPVQYENVPEKAETDDKSVVKQQ